MEDAYLINSLKEKIEHLLALYKKEKDENRQLTALVSEQKEKIELKKEEILKLNNKLQTFDLANAFLALPAENKDAKQKINAIVREIDNCIALLNR